MEQSTAITKLFRALQFRKHVKELTSACKRINKDACYEFVTYRHASPDMLVTQKKAAKFNILRSKISNYKHRSKSACRIRTRIACSSPSATIPPNDEQLPIEHLAHATSNTPANLSMIVKQSYKPLHAKSTQLNRNTIAVTKDEEMNVEMPTSLLIDRTLTRRIKVNNDRDSDVYRPLSASRDANLDFIGRIAEVIVFILSHYSSDRIINGQFLSFLTISSNTIVKALYAVSNWVFIEISETGQTGFVPVYCLRPPHPSTESASQNNLSLLNVSTYEKPRSTINVSTPSPPPGRFISSIGPCHFNIEQPSLSCPRANKSRTYTRHNKDQSNLSRQISNMSLHAYDHDAYETLNLTPCKSLSFSILDTEPATYHSNSRLRVVQNYQRQFVGDISVLESEVVTLVNTTQCDSDWRFVRRGDGRQGYIPRQIVVLDRHFN